MTLDELYQEMRAALEKPVDAATTDRLSVELARYASTVGWAAGVIDKDGRIVEAFDRLREKSIDRFEKNRDPDFSTLHDALAKLVLAIISHDEDLEPSSDSEDLDHDI